MPDYSKGQIYKLCCLDTTIKDIYVGSTVNFKQRKDRHKRETRTNTTRKVYKFIRDNGGWNNWNMIWIKDFSCDKVEELKAEEDKIMRELGATLNMFQAVLDVVERERKKKEYQNKPEIREKARQRTIKWIQDNKEKTKEKSKKYYQTHKLELAEYNKKNAYKRKEKITCECGEILSKNCLRRHKTRKPHLAYEFLKLIENSNHSKEI